MALKKCKSCGNDVAYSARRCPHCGAYRWSRGRIGYAIIILIIVLPVIYYSVQQFENSSHSPTIGKSIEVPSPPSTSAIKPYTFNGYTLNDREQTVLKTLLIQDFYSYIDGKETLLNPQIFAINISNVTANQLQSDYENNEVAGDQKYKGKALFISGVVRSINRGIGENYYISLQGGRNMFMEPHAKMADGYENYLANLQKGQTVHLVCLGNGMLIGSAMLNECVPTNIFVEKIISIRLMANITDQFSKGDSAALAAVIMSIAHASILSNSSDCFGNDDDKYNKCFTEINNNYKGNKIDKSTLMIAADKLKLDLSKIKGKGTKEDNSKLADKKKQLAIESSPSVPAAKENKNDDRFIAYDNGTVLDTETNLMWAAKDNGSDINWTDAKPYCENYRGGGYTDWRMPTQDELAGLYDSTVTNNNLPTGRCSGGYHLTNLIHLTCGVPWASETKGTGAASFNYSNGTRLLDLQSGAGYRRAIPVRSGK